MSIAFVFMLSSDLNAQVGIGTTNPSQAAMLEIASQTNGTGQYHGFLPPRVPNLTARNQIQATAEDEGLLVYVLSEHALYVWTGISWETVHKNFVAGYASDLFISEYVKGTTNNKALEIANFTGVDKNLDDYTLLISRNGGTNNSVIEFMPNFVLPHGAVYLIVHSNANEGIKSIADQIDNRINFTGNDAIIIRDASENFVDVMGDYFVDWNYGEDVTLRRRPLHGPNTSYHPTHFMVYGIDTFDGLGWHEYYP